MRSILKHIAIWIAAFWMTAFMCASCGDNSYPINGNTLVVTNEYALDENLSLYTLKYEDTRAQGLGEPTSIMRMKHDRNAFEVGDTIKLVKIEK